MIEFILITAGSIALCTVMLMLPFLIVLVRDLWCAARQREERGRRARSPREEFLIRVLEASLARTRWWRIRDWKSRKAYRNDLRRLKS